MRPPSDPIGLVEAAYNLDGDPMAWLGRVATLAAPSLDTGLGVIAFHYAATPEGRLSWSPPVLATAGDVARETLDEVNRALPPELVTALFGQRTDLVTVSEGTGLGAALADLPLVRALGHPRGVHDALGMRIANLDGAGVLLLAPMPRIDRAPVTVRHAWARIGAHLAAGLRLLRLADVPSPSPEAVLSATGELLYAEGPARSPSARARLHEAVARVEEARGELRRSDPAHALEVWHGLVAGRWSLVETVERDGRRLIIARRNDPDALDPRGLTRRERQVLGYAALGQPNKVIAYTLGLAPSTISGHLDRALRKLGLARRSDAIRFLRGLPLDPAGLGNAPGLDR